MSERWHGTAGGYTNHGCRCVDCRAAYADLKRAGTAVRAERIRRDPSLAEHGRKSTYDNWKCRCAPCRSAAAAYNRDRAARRQA